jgi:hypothetical protein
LNHPTRPKVTITASLELARELHDAREALQRARARVHLPLDCINLDRLMVAVHGALNRAAKADAAAAMAAAAQPEGISIGHDPSSSHD